MRRGHDLCIIIIWLFFIFERCSKPLLQAAPRNHQYL